jgi:predicted DNA-binding protein YlxM (UPF0122 family)
MMTREEVKKTVDNMSQADLEWLNTLLALHRQAVHTRIQRTPEEIALFNQRLDAFTATQTNENINPLLKALERRPHRREIQ